MTECESCPSRLSGDRSNILGEVSNQSVNLIAMVSNSQHNTYRISFRWNSNYTWPVRMWHIQTNYPKPSSRVHSRLQSSRQGDAEGRVKASG